MSMNVICKINTAVARRIRVWRRLASSACLAGLLSLLTALPAPGRGTASLQGRPHLDRNRASLCQRRPARTRRQGRRGGPAGQWQDCHVRRDTGSCRSGRCPGPRSGIRSHHPGIGDWPNHAGRARPRRRALADPEFQAIDGFDFYGDYSKAIAGGVTTVQIAPGSDRLLPGQGAVVKLAGADPASRVLRERESLRVQLGRRLQESAAHLRTACWGCLGREAAGTDAPPARQQPGRAPPRDCEPPSGPPKSTEPIKLFAVKKMPHWPRWPVT